LSNHLSFTQKKSAKEKGDKNVDDENENKDDDIGRRTRNK